MSDSDHISAPTIADETADAQLVARVGVNDYEQNAGIDKLLPAVWSYAAAPAVDQRHLLTGPTAASPLLQVQTWHTAVANQATATTRASRSCLPGVAPPWGSAMRACVTATWHTAVANQVTATTRVSRSCLPGVAPSWGSAIRACVMCLPLLLRSATVII